MCVTEDKVKNIVQEQITPLNENFRSVRNWAIGLLTTLLLALFGMGVWVGTVDSQVGTVIKAQDQFESRVEMQLTRIEDLILDLTKEVSRQ